MKLFSFLAAASTVAFAAPSVAQTVDHSNMPGMTSPAKTAEPECLPEHAAMGHCTPAAAPAEEQRTGSPPDPEPTDADPHAGHDMAGMSADDRLPARYRGATLTRAQQGGDRMRGERALNLVYPIWPRYHTAEPIFENPHVK